MANTHEYTIFDRAEIDPALSLKWADFDKKYPGWGEWSSAEEFLVDWALDDPAQIEAVDEILKKKTVRATLVMCDDPFHFLWGILASKRGLKTRDVNIHKGDFTYGDEILSCAGAGYIRGELSLASLTAVYHIHAAQVDPFEVLPLDIAVAVLEQPRRLPMLPYCPNITDGFGDEIGVSESRRFIEFLRKAWRHRWPLYIDAHEQQKENSIRATAVAQRFEQQLRRCNFTKPCIFRWYGP